MRRGVQAEMEVVRLWVTRVCLYLDCGFLLVGVLGFGCNYGIGKASDLTK